MNCSYFFAGPKRSWIALACAVIVFPLFIAIGELLQSVTGATAEDSLLSTLISGVVGIAILIAAPVLALIFGRRAMQEGDGRAKVPSIIAVVLIVVFVAETLPALIQNAL